MTLDGAISYHRALALNAEIGKEAQIHHQKLVEWLCELRQLRERMPKLDQIIYALRECKDSAYLCEYCAHRDTDPDIDESVIKCPMMDEARRLMLELGYEVSL